MFEQKKRRQQQLAFNRISVHYSLVLLIKPRVRHPEHQTLTSNEADT